MSAAERPLLTAELFLYRPMHPQHSYKQLWQTNLTDAGFVHTCSVSHNNIYDPDVSLKLEYNLGCSTRVNKCKLLNCIFCHNLRKYYFSARVINIWNSLPNCVVDVSRPTINQFKARLDKFWLHQDILYDYTADLTGIGDRSVHVTKDE